MMEIETVAEDEGMSTGAIELDGWVPASVDRLVVLEEHESCRVMWTWGCNSCYTGGKSLAIRNKALKH